MIRRKLGITAAALVAAAGSAMASPLRMDYCVQDQGGGVYLYTFTLVLDNNDNSWTAGQGFGWFIFGDEPGSPQGTGVSPLTNFNGDLSSLPAGPFTQFQGSGGGHNGPTMGPVVLNQPPNYPANLWTPNGIGDSISWRGTATADLLPGSLKWSNLMAGGGANYANWEVASRLPSCNGQPSGACCRVDGTCFLTTQTSCANGGGIYRGDGSPCATANCPQPPTGACCLPNLTCSITYAAGCTGAGGTYHGDNSTCASANCPVAWVEQGDAGNLPGTAQVPQGSGPLLGIVGVLDPSDADMYKIQICDFANFSARTVGGATFDTQLFLFDSTGHGLSSDDDDPQGTGVQSRLSAQFVPNNGDYYLALSGYDLDPIGDTSGGLIWSSTPYNVERRPDGPAAGEGVAGWGGGGGGGSYTIFLTGSCYPGATSHCYANCDGSTAVPFLNIGDFVCFQSAFAAGSSYANCDGSTAPPVLNIGDFVCFQSAFAAGCSAP